MPDYSPATSTPLTRMPLPQKWAIKQKRMPCSTCSGKVIRRYRPINRSWDTPGDRAYCDHAQASRPFSIDRKGFVLSEGAAVVLLAAEESLQAYGLKPKAEVLGIGWTSDAYHYTSLNAATIIRAIKETIEDAGLKPEDIQYINAHGTSTPKGDQTEIECLREVFGKKIEKIPVSSNKSQLGHTFTRPTRVFSGRPSLWTPHCTPRASGDNALGES
jgi:hypothetical protein